MEESSKKNVSAWYAAATHFLTAGFVIPFVVRIIGVILFALIIKESNPTINGIVTVVLGVIGIWLGIMYSSKYIYKKYVVSNYKSVINLSTLYLVILEVIFAYFLVINTEVTKTEMYYTLAYYIVLIVSFYLFSKKYITKNNNQPTV